MHIALELERYVQRVSAVTSLYRYVALLASRSCSKVLGVTYAIVRASSTKRNLKNHKIKLSACNRELRAAFTSLQRNDRDSKIEHIAV